MIYLLVVIHGEGNLRMLRISKSSSAAVADGLPPKHQVGPEPRIRQKGLPHLEAISTLKGHMLDWDVLVRRPKTGPVPRLTRDPGVCRLGPLQARAPLLTGLEPRREGKDEVLREP